jgi:predicted extracellular nuclease/methionine-rich copper-binding protein CopC
MRRISLVFLSLFLAVFLVSSFVTLATAEPKLAGAASLVELQSNANTSSPNLVISQVYGGGGGSGYYLYDYVELFNRGLSPVTLDGWSLQYGSATGNFASTGTNLYTFPDGIIVAPGRYFLVQLGSAGTSGLALPTTPDLVTTNLNMAQGNGKVALANINSALGCGATATPCLLPDSRIVDLAAYGTSNNAEGDVTINYGVALTNQQGGVRKMAGCQDTDVNGDDFDVLSGASLLPRNSSSPSHSCSGAPTVMETEPPDAATNVPLDTTITVTFSEEVSVTTTWFSLECSDSGSMTGATTPAGPAESYTITPDSLFAYGEQCTVTILADQVTNAGDIPMDADYVFSFSLEALEGDVTFVYHDLEGVVQAGEAVYLAGGFNDWDPAALPLVSDAAYEIFTVTVAGLAAGDYEYKYIVYTDDTPGGPPQWEWLNTHNRSLTVSGSTTLNDYRHVLVGWANLQWPPATATDMGTATENIYGKLYIQGVTNEPDTGGRGVAAEVGYGTAADPADWNWFPMSYWTDDGPNNDEFAGVMIPTLPGVFSYTTRYDGNWGPGNPNASWTYASLNGIPYDPEQTGVLSVNFVAVPIADARAGSNGQVFALEGQVTAQNSTWNNAPEWAFQDESAGIAAFFLTSPPVSLGDTVRLVATRGNFSNQEQMVAPVHYFEVVSSGPPVTPLAYTTGEVGNGMSEGWLVQMEGVVSSMPATCGTAYSVTLNDGSGPATVRIEAATGINLCAIGIQNGDLLGVAGFSTQFQTTYQVKPRNVGDLELFVEAPVIVSTTPANNATNVAVDALITLGFNEAVTVTGDWFSLSCSQSGAVTGVTSPAGPATSYTITPDEMFVNGDICVVTILADQVSNDQGVNLFANYVFNFTVGPAPAMGNCGDPVAPIHFVQGSGPVTPLFGATVVVEAVVVGSYQPASQFRGFFLQERDERADDDPATSEGIFVFDNNLGVAVAPGNLVRVRGTATEFSGLTQVGSVSHVAVCGTDYSVTPAEITLPVDNLNDWEAVEGMLVSFTHDLYVTEHYNLGRFGEVHLSVDDRLWQPTNIVAPGAAANARQALNNRSRIILDDGLSTQNPATVIYPDPGLTYTNTLRTGAVVHDLVGVLDYRSSSYRVQPVGVVDFSNTAARPETMDDVGGTIKVASFNVLNYFTTLDTGAPICGPQQNMGCRGANNAFEFERQRTKILNAILLMDVDVIGLIEIENHHNDEAVIDLVAGLNDLAGAGAYAYIDTGVIGGDAIKQAFIYRPATVMPVGDYAILDSSVDPAFLDTKNRPVLIQTFADNHTGQMITVAVNHLKSKGSPCEDVGDPDMGDGQGNCNVTRTQAAAVLVNYLATDPTGAGSDRFLIIGDINAYAMEDPIRLIRDAGYTDLLRYFYEDEAYSYVFDGQFGHLDHALASPGALPFVTGTTAWHINADEPRVLDYNTEFKTAQQIAEWYGPGPFRSSDHDPVVVGLDFPVPGAAFNLEAYEVLEGAGELIVSVVLDAPLAFEVTVTYETADGTAVAGIDYVATSGALVFPPGTTSNAFTVEILDNHQPQPDRFLTLYLTAFGEISTAVLTILDDDPPVASFVTNSPVKAGQPALFTNTTVSFGPTSYAWNFGDGSPVVTEENPTHLYGAAGSYTVILTATNAFGSSVATATFEVHAYKVYLPLVARDAAPAGSLPEPGAIALPQRTGWQTNRR